MGELKEFKLPDVGEGLTEADIVAWHVKPGDQVEDGQIIVEIETAKAVVELPSPWDGTVARLLAEEGQTVEVGVPIIAVEVAGGDKDAERASVPASAPTRAAAGQLGQADAEVLGQLAHRRLGQRAGRWRRWRPGYLHRFGRHLRRRGHLGRLGARSGRGDGRRRLARAAGGG